MHRGICIPCPFNAKYVPVLEETAKNNGIPFRAVKIESRETAQNAPTPITTYALFYDGQYICWTKSCLLSALLRANGIPAGISYQLLTRADDDDSEGYIIHALNTVYIEEQNKWIRLDARGNKENVHAEFCIEEEHLAFPVRSEFGEVDYRNNDPDLDERLVSILNNSENILEITTDFTMD